MLQNLKKGTRVVRIAHKPYDRHGEVVEDYNPLHGSQIYVKWDNINTKTLATIGELELEKANPLNTNFFIIVCDISGEKRWEGKGWSSSQPAKVYSSFDDAVNALKAYWFHGVQEKGVLQPDDRQVIIKPLTQHDLDLYLTQKLIRF